MRREENYLMQLADYIKRNLAKGYTMESLKWALINQGHSKVEVGKAIDLANKELAKQAPVLKEKPIIKVETIPPQPEQKSLFSKLKRWFD